MVNPDGSPQYTGENPEKMKNYVVKIMLDVHSVMKPVQKRVGAVRFIHGAADLLSTLQQEGYSEETIKNMEIFEITKVKLAWESIEAHFEQPAPKNYEPILGYMEKA